LLQGVNECVNDPVNIVGAWRIFSLGSYVSSVKSKVTGIFCDGTNISFSCHTITMHKHTLGTNIIYSYLSEGIQYVI
jgi:hypothetical protein